MFRIKKAGIIYADVLLAATLLATVSVAAFQIKYGKSSECLGNLKQINLALVMFYQDNGALPNARLFPESQSDPQGIHNILGRYLGARSKVFFCPCVPAEVNSKGTSYIWNTDCNGRALESLPETTWMMTEITAVNKNLPSPHEGGYGILFADGHAVLGPRVPLPEVKAPEPQKAAMPLPKPVIPEKTAPDQKPPEATKTIETPHFLVELPETVTAGKCEITVYKSNVQRAQNSFHCIFRRFIAVYENELIACLSEHINKLRR